MSLPQQATARRFNNSNIGVRSGGVFAVMCPRALPVTRRAALFCLGGDEREGEDGESSLEDMLNANVSPPVSRALAETIGWILFDMDEQYALSRSVSASVFLPLNIFHSCPRGLRGTYCKY